MLIGNRVVIPNHVPTMPTSFPVWLLESWQWTLSQGVIILAAMAIRGVVPAALLAGVVSWLARRRDTAVSA